MRVSPATLSYWQSGRSRPERRDSLIALRHLEGVLEVPQGSLAALLGPPRPRGRWGYSASGLPAIGALWPESTPWTQALGQVDTTWDERLTRGDTVLTEHEVVHVPPGPIDANYERKFRLPVREYVMEVCCEQYTRDDHGVEKSRPVSPDPGGSVHGVALNFGPGCYGFRWSQGS